MTALGYTVTAFTDVGSHTWTSPVTGNVEILVVGGGAAGAIDHGGGGERAVLFCTTRTA